MINLPLANDEQATALPEYWRSLEELSPAFRSEIEREFPESAGLLDDPVSRRRFLTLMAASLSLAGVTGCGRAVPDKIVPRVRQPENTIPGKAKFYATAMPHPGGAVGLLVESHEGRPTKIEGNPLHPASLGAAGVHEQASILGFYDSDRAKVVKNDGQVTGWADAWLALKHDLTRVIAKSGRGFALLTGQINSTTLAAQIQHLLKEWPAARWYMHDPLGNPGLQQATRMLFGQRYDLVYDFDQADVIVALDSDVMASGPNHLRYARQISRRRDPNGKMNRLFAAESMPTPTGSFADQRRAMRPSAIAEFARQLWLQLGQKSANAGDFGGLAASELQRHVGRSAVVAGPSLAGDVQAIALAINERLGNLGKSVLPILPVDATAELGLTELCQAIDGGEIDAILILGANPVYTSPPNMEFAARLGKVPTRICLAEHEHETSMRCNWQLPETHYLEMWSDARAADGTASIIQPLIAPLYDGRSAHEVIAALMQMLTNREDVEIRGREIVRSHWRGWHREHSGNRPFEEFWRTAVHDGVIEGTAAKPVNVKLAEGWTPPPPRKSEDVFELILRADPSVLDGRFANNAWLQELPKPLTKLTWENAAIVSPATARELGIEQREGPHGGSHGETITELVELTVRGLTVTAPVFVLPGHPDQSATLHLGYGRQNAGRVADRIGTNAFVLASVSSPGSESGLQLRRTGRAYTLACTQLQHSMHGRDIARLVTMGQFLKDPSCAPAAAHHQPASAGHNPPVEGLSSHELYTNPQTAPPFQWGMAVDLGACHGCNACVVACQAENNIPTVGKDLITRGRAMHWLRIDRYFTGALDQPEVVHMPVMCQHCENAPCEVVCPVEATTHSPDGLNEMTYNRCVGTRYCANNCPYKVRRFNFLQYVDYADQSLALQRNPDVSVRVRGVMEKCTYCVQRIREAEITAKTHRRPIGEADIVTACQAACPTQAIVFGNIADPNSRVSRLKSQPRNYGILTELNTKPRTTYLAAVRNPS